MKRENKGVDMDILRKFELTLATWYEKTPHLSPGVRKWLAENAWWIVLIGVIFSIMGLLGVALILGLLLIGINMGLEMTAGLPAGALINATVSGIIIIVTIISLLEFIVQTILMALAISPLQKGDKRGWDLLFLVLVINTVLMVVGNVISVNIAALAIGLLFAAIAGYFLFELRDRFNLKKVDGKLLNTNPAKEDPEAELPT